MGIVQKYFKNLYNRTMSEAYLLAIQEITSAVMENGKLLDCGAGAGSIFHRVNEKIEFPKHRYFGVEIDEEYVRQANDAGLDIVQGDLNQKLPYADNEFRCVAALSVLEHLFYPCSFIREVQRVLAKNGQIVLITPNISTFFTIGLLMAGKMPSSGPQPDSVALIRAETNIQVADWFGHHWTDSDVPATRHLIVFSYRVLKKYLTLLNFKDIKGYGFGLYPFPNFMQPYLEKFDPYHCHQMVFTARK